MKRRQISSGASPHLCSQPTLPTIAALTAALAIAAALCGCEKEHSSLPVDEELVDLPSQEVRSQPSFAAPTEGLTANIPEDERLCLLPMGIEQMLGDQLKVGDHVDILGLFEVEESDKIIRDPSISSRGFLSMSMLQDPTVLAVYPPSSWDQSGALGLSATIDECEMFQLTARRGSLRALLRRPGDDEIGMVKKNTLKELLLDLEVMNIERRKRQRERQEQEEQPARVASRYPAKDMRVFGLRTRLPAPLIAGLREGDRLDLLGTFALDSADGIADSRAQGADRAPRSDSAGEPEVRPPTPTPPKLRERVTMTLLQNVRLRGVQREPVRGADALGVLLGRAPRRHEGSTAQSEVLLLLELDHEEAMLVELADKRGELDIMWRAKDDIAFGTVKRKTIKEVLQDLEVINIERRKRIKRRLNPRLKKSGPMIIKGASGGGSVSRSRAARGRLKKKPRARPIIISGDGPSPRPSSAKKKGDASTSTRDDNLSTFALDVDSGSFSLARAALKDGKMPSQSEVRPEEWINYFGYNYAYPKRAMPFHNNVELAPHPVHAGKHLLRIGLQARRPDKSERRPVHLTFLIDTSGSMEGSDRLTLAQYALRHLVSRLDREDTVSIVTFAGGPRLMLTPTEASKKEEILKVIEGLKADGGTGMEAGLKMAYRLAADTIVAGHENRVVLLSDGVANIGSTSHTEMLETIKAQRQQGITLSTVGFGQGNFHDENMEQLADKGDGNYFYVDSYKEAERVFGMSLLSRLLTLARDAKMQVEFNPVVVKSWKQIGYANRQMADEDFTNPDVDAGEVGPGQQATALYEIELQPDALPTSRLATSKLRFVNTDNGKRQELRAKIKLGPVSRERFEQASADFRWAAMIALLALKMRGELEVPYARLQFLAKGAAGEMEQRISFFKMLAGLREP